MSTHRLQEFFRHPLLAPLVCGAIETNFVPCPVFASMSQRQQTQVLEIYRIAAELTREQLHPRRKVPAFSLN